MTTAAICLGIYAVLCVAGAVGLERARRTVPPTPEYVRWLPLLPPVPAPVTPPFSQTTPDVSWFRDIPSDCLGDDAIRLLADDIAEHFHVIDGAQ